MMLEAPTELIQELKDIFRRYDISLWISEEYDGEENYCGESIEIKSNSFVNGFLPIFIDDIHGLAKLINS